MEQELKPRYRDTDEYWQAARHVARVLVGLEAMRAAKEAIDHVFADSLVSVYSPTYLWIQESTSKMVSQLENQLKLAQARCETYRLNYERE